MRASPMGLCAIRVLRSWTAAAVACLMALNMAGCPEGTPGEFEQFVRDAGAIFGAARDSAAPETAPSAARDDAAADSDEPAGSDGSAGDARTPDRDAADADQDLDESDARLPDDETTVRHAPVIKCPESLTVECNGVGTAQEIEDWLASVEIDSVCEDLTVTHDYEGANSAVCGEMGSALVIWTATDACGQAQCSALLRVVDTTPPTISLNGPDEMTLECHVDEYEELGATVMDLCDASLTEPEIGGDAVDVDTPGIYVVTYEAVDSCGNRSESIERTVRVVDTLPPEITIKAMIEIWPPNHKYIEFKLSDCVTVTDLCEGEVNVDKVGEILSIYSDEPEDAKGGGDGHTMADIVILDNSTFKLRAERQGGGNGRVYGVHFQVTDAAGNVAEGLCKLGVPHDRSGDPPVDDGPQSGHIVK